MLSKIVDAYQGDGLGRRLVVAGVVVSCCCAVTFFGALVVGASLKIALFTLFATAFAGIAIGFSCATYPD